MSLGGYEGPGRYRHYKGGEYEVLGIALVEKNWDPLVVYRPTTDRMPDNHGASFWTRPLWDFNAVPEDGRPRFERA